MCVTLDERTIRRPESWLDKASREHLKRDSYAEEGSAAKTPLDKNPACNSTAAAARWHSFL